MAAAPTRARLRVGVTGHRDLADPVVASAQVDRILAELMAEHLAGREADLTVVSSLAEGADRLVAERALVRGGAALHAILPLPPADYRSDFGPASALAFDRLLAQAERVDVSPSVPGEPREAAYERAGRAVVAASDVLLALWDGRPARGRGGTAHIVANAVDHGRRVVVLAVERVERVGPSTGEAR